MLGRLQEQHPLAELKPVLLPDEIAAMQRQVRSVLVDDVVKRYMVSLADASRRHPQVSLGISPRGTLAWMGASQAMAYFKGRSFVTPDDVKAVAEAVLVHRIVLKTEAKIAGISGERVLRELLAKVDVPIFARVSGVPS